MSATVTTKTTQVGELGIELLRMVLEFNLGREMPVVCFDGAEVKSRLLHSVKNNWVGWVPCDEIEIKVRH